MLSQLCSPNEVAQHRVAMTSGIPSIVKAVLKRSDLEQASLAYRLLQSPKPPKVISDGDRLSAKGALPCGITCNDVRLSWRISAAVH